MTPDEQIADLRRQLGEAQTEIKNLRTINQAWNMGAIVMTMKNDAAMKADLAAAREEIERLKGLLGDLKGCGDEVHAFDIQDSRERVFFAERLKANRQRDRLRAGIEGLIRDFENDDTEYRANYIADALKALLSPDGKGG